MKPSRRRFVRDGALFVGAALLPRSVRAQSAAPEFDYVIVGAGSSGCVLANRLSADPNVRVLVLEAGGADANPAIHAPGKWTSLLETDVDWNYVTESDPGLGGRQLKWPRGKTVGGSSAINAMAYVRGHRRCFDDWAKVAGPAWSFDQLLPLFTRLEDNSRGATEFTGAGGPLAVADTVDPHAGHLAFLDATREQGFEADPRWNFNGAKQDDVAGFYQKTIRAGRRHSAADAFLRPAESRANLTVWPATRVHRLLLTRRRVTGLEISRDDRVQRLRVGREVILAAGVIESPKILMLSGIGPAAALRRHGIAVVLDARGVGANLHDHPRIALRWNARTPLAPSSVSAGLFTRSRRAAIADPPDIQFYIGRGLDVPDPFITLTVALSQPRSRGTVTLRSADPTAPPEIRPGYFREPSDVDALLDGVHLAQAIGESPGYARLRGAPAAPEEPLRGDAEVRAYITRTADTIFHPVGTCRMGRDLASVVDPQLKVRGIEGLRVADASIMPATVNSQTSAACMVIAERAADFISGRPPR